MTMISLLLALALPTQWGNATPPGAAAEAFAEAAPKLSRCAPRVVAEAGRNDTVSILLASFGLLIAVHGAMVVLEGGTGGKRASGSLNVVAGVVVLGAAIYILAAA